MIRIITILLIIISFAGAQSKSELKNVKVLPFTKKQDIVNYMKKTMVPGLGVKCKFCHNPLDFSSDEKENKLVAREMMKMVKGINFNTMSKLKFHEVSCFTCHRGQDHPDHPPKH